jgi:lysine 2,3-aminomutase
VVQECVEEKSVGEISYERYNKNIKYSFHHEGIRKNIDHLRKLFSVPFLSADRSVMNLPGVGKSLSFRTIGITNDGRRILEFDHDASRNHSPIIKKMGKIVIIESKSIDEYLNQIEQIGDDTSEYQGVWGYSLGQTEPRFPLFEYPEYDFKITKILTNLET